MLKHCFSLPSWYVQKYLSRCWLQVESFVCRITFVNILLTLSILVLLLYLTFALEIKGEASISLVVE